MHRHGHAEPDVERVRAGRQRERPVLRVQADERGDAREGDRSVRGRPAPEYAVLPEAEIELPADVIEDAAREELGLEAARERLVQRRDDPAQRFGLGDCYGDAHEPAAPPPLAPVIQGHGDDDRQEEARHRRGHGEREEVAKARMAEVVPVEARRDAQVRQDDGRGVPQEVARREHAGEALRQA